MQRAKLIQRLAPSGEKQAWKAECIEICPLGLGKGSWKRANVQSPGTESVVSIALASPFGDEVTRQLPCAPCHASQYPW